jgi:16S rRNA (cytosine967-C5)-methyltransferase
MTGESAKSARAIAAEVLQQFDPKRSYAAPLLDRLLDQTQERQRATDLVLGTVRNLRAIDAIITKFSGRPIERIGAALLAVIRVAINELVFNPDTPAYSIVNEAVNNAKATGGARQSGFVNAVLRQIGRHILNRQAQSGQTPPTRTLVRPDGGGCEFDSDILPNPDVSGAAYLSACFSLPLWLVTEWIADFGFEQARNTCVASNRRPSVYLRVNPLRATAANLLDRLASEEIKAEVVPIEGCRIIKVVSPRSVAELPGFAEGWFTVQDLSATSAVRLLDPQPGWTVLDLCAAPGTKTTQLAEAMRDTGIVRATDVDAERLNRVTQNVERLALRSVEVVSYKQMESGPPIFDAVLLDAPCSNTGVLAKRIEVRFRITSAAVAKLVATQQKLLDRAVMLTKPGGRICYSTCSISRAEDADLVRRYVGSNSRVEWVKEELVLPSAEGFDHDGAYAAVLQRRG